MYSEDKGRAASPGPDGAPRTSAGNRPRSVGRSESGPTSGPSQPSSSPTFQRAAQSVRTAEEAGACDGAARRDHPLSRAGKFVQAARRRQCPYVLEPEVVRELVDAPGPGGVRGVREPHAGTSI